MIKFIKKHVGLIIVLILVLVFPTCLSNQAMLNMRIIVTGLAIDKIDDGYEVTAQYVKTSPGSESSGTSATINFVADNDETMFGAISKLAYKAGKVSAFTHTNFIIIGKDVLSENIAELLDYFIRNQMIRSSALLLFAEKTASEELKKTENIELSVGLGLQKVFLFKEKESDGQMMSVIKFLNDSKSYSKTATASTLKLQTNKENTKLADDGGSSSGESQSKMADGKGAENTSTASNSEKYNFFESLSPVYCFFDGEFIGMLKDKDEVSGFMIADNNAKNDRFSMKNISVGRLQDATVSLNIKNKNTNFKLNYEEFKPVLDIHIVVDNCEIEEIKNSKLIGELSQEEFDEIKRQIEIDAGTKIGKCFEKSKELGIDIFHAYDLANRFNYKITKKYYENINEFINDLIINVEVDVQRMDY